MAVDPKPIHVLRDHYGFILPLFVTFACGIIFARITLYVMNSGAEGTEKTTRFFPVLLDMMIPSIATYSLCQILNNLSVVIKSGNHDAVWSIMSIVLLSVYLLSAGAYYVGKTTCSIAILIIESIALLIFVGLSYKEGYHTLHRNHGLV